MRDKKTLNTVCLGFQGRENDCATTFFSFHVKHMSDELLCTKRRKKSSLPCVRIEMKFLCYKYLLVLFPLTEAFSPSPRLLIWICANSATNIFPHLFRQKVWDRASGESLFVGISKRRKKGREIFGDKSLDGWPSLLAREGDREKEEEEWENGSITLNSREGVYTNSDVVPRKREWCFMRKTHNNGFSLYVLCWC